MFEFSIDNIVDKYYNFIQDAVSYQSHHLVSKPRFGTSRELLKRNLFIWSEYAYRDRSLDEVAEEYDMRPIKVLRIARMVDNHIKLFLEREAA